MKTKKKAKLYLLRIGLLSPCMVSLSLAQSEPSPRMQMFEEEELQEVIGEVYGGGVLSEPPKGKNTRAPIGVSGNNLVTFFSSSSGAMLPAEGSSLNDQLSAHVQDAIRER